VSASNPVNPILDTLSKYSHDNDLVVTLNATFAMGFVGASQGGGYVKRKNAFVRETLKGETADTQGSREKESLQQKEEHWKEEETARISSTELEGQKTLEEAERIGEGEVEVTTAEGAFKDKEDRKMQSASLLTEMTNQVKASAAFWASVDQSREQPSLLR